MDRGMAELRGSGLLNEKRVAAKFVEEHKKGGFTDVTDGINRESNNALNLST